MSTTPLILALDQGTTSSRAILFDRALNPCASAQQEFPQLYPQPGWVEHDPNAIWESQLATMHDVLARAEATPEQIAAIVPQISVQPFDSSIEEPESGRIGRKRETS